jgi:hypothetical protein
MNYLLIYFVTLLATILTSIGLLIWMPEQRYYLYLEDHFIVNLGAFELLATFILGIPFSIHRKKYRLTLIFLAFIGILGFMVEVGFGKCWLSIDTFSRGEIILNALNAMFTHAYYLMKRIYDSHPIFFYLLLGGSFILTVFMAFKYRKKLMGYNKWGDLTQTYLLALFFVTLLLAGTVLDLANIQKYLMIALEELFELFSAQALFFCLISLYRPGLSMKVRTS